MCDKDGKEKGKCEKKCGGCKKELAPQETLAQQAQRPFTQEEVEEGVALMEAEMKEVEAEMKETGRYFDCCGGIKEPGGHEGFCDVGIYAAEKALVARVEVLEAEKKFHKWSDIQDKMLPEQKARIEAKVQEELAKMPKTCPKHVYLGEPMLLCNNCADLNDPPIAGADAVPTPEETAAIQKELGLGELFDPFTNAKTPGDRCEVVDDILYIWNKFPDLRIAQLLINVADGRDLFYSTDQQFSEMLFEFAKKYEKKEDKS